MSMRARSDCSDCQWGEWSEWSCSSPCGAGLGLRRREVEVEARGSGASCEGDSEEQGDCQSTPCSRGSHLTQLTLLILPYLLLSLTTILILLLCCRDRLFIGKPEKQTNTDTTI